MRRGRLTGHTPTTTTATRRTRFFITAITTTASLLALLFTRGASALPRHHSNTRVGISSAAFASSFATTAGGSSSGQRQHRRLLVAAPILLQQQQQQQPHPLIMPASVGRRSTSSSTVVAAAAASAGGAGGEEAPAPKKRGRPRKAPAAATSDADDAPTAESSSSKPQPKAKKPRAASRMSAAVKGNEEEGEGEGGGKTGGKKKGAAAASATTAAAKPKAKAKPSTTGRATIPRAPTPRAAALASLTLPPGRRLLRLVSWNVAGLRGLMRKENAAGALRALLERERPDVLCLQETKLQEDHVAEVSAALKELHLPRFEGNWHCSTAKKGYSGTVVLLSQDSGLTLPDARVTCGIGNAEGDGEGRVMTADLGPFSLVNVYTPNAGEGLKRLGFRVGTWDRAFEGHLKGLMEAGDKGKGVLCCGDLNVAHLDADFFCPGEPRMKKSAGTTPEERNSFSQLLEGTGMVDTFRHFHPDATGCYSYWSMRAGNRPYNRGMRLDYFLASPEMVTDDPNVFPRVVDAFILDQEEALKGLSDHAPVGVVVAV